MSTPFVILAIAFANGWIKVPVRWALVIAPSDFGSFHPDTSSMPASSPARALRVFMPS
jgi:hypothetical protein